MGQGGGGEREVLLFCLNWHSAQAMCEEVFFFKASSFLIPPPPKEKNFGKDDAGV